MPANRRGSLAPRSSSSLVTLRTFLPKFCGGKGRRTSHDSCRKVVRDDFCVGEGGSGPPSPKIGYRPLTKDGSGPQKTLPGVGGPPSLGRAVNAAAQPTQATKPDVSGLSFPGPGPSHLIGSRTFTHQHTWDDSWQSQSSFRGIRNAGMLRITQQAMNRCAPTMLDSSPRG